MAKYKEPKVTKADDKTSGIGKWIGIAVAVLVVLLLLAWLLGWFGSDETEVEAIEPAVTEESEVIE